MGLRHASQRVVVTRSQLSNDETLAHPERPGPYRFDAGRRPPPGNATPSQADSTTPRQTGIGVPQSTGTVSIPWFAAQPQAIINQ